MKKISVLSVLSILFCLSSYGQQNNFPSGYDVAAIREFRNKLLADPYRPVYHFAIPEDYAVPSDPNGCIYWGGRYHMFHIFQDRGVHVFAHLSSLDMIHWREHPKALYPTHESKIEGIFSGNCFVNKKGEATMLYHGVGQGNSISLSSDPLLNQWRQLPSNPVVPDPKDRPAIANETDRDSEGGAPYASWDPHGWVEGDTYYAIFGGKRPAVFKAAELNEWSYVGDLFGTYLPDVSKSEDVSCPDFFTLGGKKVLLCISHHLGCRYYVGTWKDEKFYPENHACMSFADNTFFAPESLLTPDGRRVMWALLFDARNQEVVQKSGWSGMMSLPRELFMRKDHTLGMRPVSELRSLRYNEKSYAAQNISKVTPLVGATGDVKEIVVEIDPREATKCGVRILESQDGKEYGEIYYDVSGKKLVLDMSRLNAIGMAPVTPLGVEFKKVEEAPFELQKGEKLVLDILIDKCIVEVYANERQALVRTNAFFSESNEKNISLFGEGGSARFKSVTVWDMMPSNFY